MTRQEINKAIAESARTKAYAFLLVKQKKAYEKNI